MDPPTTPARPRYGRWRAATLLTVYVLMAAHFAHWKLSERTLAPLELNEVMHTLELGIVTAGFVFMLLALVSVLLFGRFFCSWGCHILALEDLCAWLLAKLKMRPRPVRSRVLLLVPLGAMLYMFVWPQIARMLAGRPLPELVVLQDQQGWASFLTTDFARNLPGPGVALLTFAVCGFLIVYALGSRSFCRFACPYGAIFALADRVAPGRIVSTGQCSSCGRCTAACQSGIAVHQELATFGTVVDSACLKDLDCISTCPNGSISFGFTRPPLLRPGLRKRRPKPRHDFSWTEELLMGAVFLASLAVFRGLYGQLPFLLSLGIGAISACVFVTVWRLARRPAVRLGGLQLKLLGKLRRAGKVFSVSAAIWFSLFVHSAFVRYHEFAGQRAYEQIAHASQPASRAALQRAITHLEWTQRWGLVAGVDVHRQLGGLYESLASQHVETDNSERAIASLEQALRHRPGDPDLLLSLGELLANAGRLPQAAKVFASSVAVDPGHAPARYNLAVVLTQLGREPEAIAQYREATRLSPDDPEIRNNLGFLLLRNADLDGAEACFRKAIALKQEFAHPHFNLGNVLTQRGQMSEAWDSMQRAAQLDPRYAQMVQAATAEAGGRTH